MTQKSTEGEFVWWKIVHAAGGVVPGPAVGQEVEAEAGAAGQGVEADPSPEVDHAARVAVAQGAAVVIGVIAARASHDRAPAQGPAKSRGAAAGACPGHAPGQRANRGAEARHPT